MIVWITGRSGTGKSTLSRAVCDALKYRNIKTVLLDTDKRIPGLYDGINLLAEWGNNVREVTLRLAKLACNEPNDGRVVLCVAGSPFANERLQARKMVEPQAFVEVCTKCSLSVLEERDTHGHYALGPSPERRSQLEYYEYGTVPECEVDTEKMTIEESVNKILHTILKVYDLDNATQEE